MSMLIFRLFTLNSPTLHTLSAHILGDIAPHPAEMEPQHPIAPVPFATLQALLKRLKIQQTHLADALRDHPELSSDEGLIGKLARAEDMDVFRIARRLEQVVKTVGITFPNEPAWRVANEFDSTIYAFLKRRLVPSYQSAVVVKLDELDAALRCFRENPGETTYHDAVRTQRNDS
jgi:hypothetical protein